MLGALVCAWVAGVLTGRPSAIAIDGTWGKTLADYGTMLVRELAARAEGRPTTVQRAVAYAVEGHEGFAGGHRGESQQAHRSATGSLPARKTPCLSDRDRNDCREPKDLLDDGDRTIHSRMDQAVIVEHPGLGELQLVHGRILR